MRYLELLTTDLADTTEPHIRTEWIHRDHIETIEPYTTARAGRPMLWLELTLTSGRIRYIPLRPVDPGRTDEVARQAINTILDSGTDPIRAATLTRTDDDPEQANSRPMTGDH